MDQPAVFINDLMLIGGAVLNSCFETIKTTAGCGTNKNTFLIPEISKLFIFREDHSQWTLKKPAFRLQRGLEQLGPVSKVADKSFIIVAGKKKKKDLCLFLFSI